jgi:hypothetical protein
MSIGNIGAISCAALGAVFLCMALIFALRKEKAVMLIAGFNALSKEERSSYDCARMSRDMRNSLLWWCAVLLAGAVLSFFISSHFAILAAAIWLVLFFREVKIDVDKAFRKYKP